MLLIGIIILHTNVVPQSCANSDFIISSTPKGWEKNQLSRHSIFDDFFPVVYPLITLYPIAKKNYLAISLRFTY